jgi:hypothetical protein
MALKYGNDSSFLKVADLNCWFESICFEQYIARRTHIFITNTMVYNALSKHFFSILFSLVSVINCLNEIIFKFV